MLLYFVIIVIMNILNAGVMAVLVGIKHCSYGCVGGV